MGSLYDKILKEKQAHDEQQLRLAQEKVRKELEIQKNQRILNTKITIKIVLILVSIVLSILLFYNHVGTYNEFTVIPNFLMLQFITISVCYLLSPDDIGSSMVGATCVIGGVFGAWMGILLATSTSNTFSMIINFLIIPIPGAIGGVIGGLIIGGIVRFILKALD